MLSLEWLGDFKVSSRTAIQMTGAVPALCMRWVETPLTITRAAQIRRGKAIPFRMPPKGDAWGPGCIAVL